MAFFVSMCKTKVKHAYNITSDERKSKEQNQPELLLHTKDDKLVFVRSEMIESLPILLYLSKKSRMM